MDEKIMKVYAIQQRRDSVANWESKNPILLDGEQITVVFPDGSTRHKTGYNGKRYSELHFNNNVIKPINSTLLVHAWINHQQSIPISGLTANQNGLVGISCEATDAQYEAAANASIRMTQSDGALTFSCKNDPDDDIPITIVLFD